MIKNFVNYTFWRPYRELETPEGMIPYTLYIREISLQPNNRHKKTLCRKT